jgi:hypothetical protein
MVAKRSTIFPLRFLYVSFIKIAVPKGAAAMHLSLMFLGAHILEVMFFTGLVGCVAVVVISWISIFKEGFTDDNKSN